MQINALREAVGSALLGYEGGLSGLGQLINRTETLIDALGPVAEADWVARLRREWGQLEIIYAVALDEGRSELSDEEQRDIGSAIQKLQSLVGRPSKA